MQKLFSMFPPGTPGLGLFLLRASVAAGLLLEVHGLRQGLSVWVHATALAISAALCVGYLTPIAAAVALALHGWLWLDAGFDSTAVAAVIALDAVALALLGPGAYSADSWQFGRRVVVLPPE